MDGDGGGILGGRGLDRRMGDGGNGGGSHSLSRSSQSQVSSPPCLDGGEGPSYFPPPAYIALFFTSGGVAHRSSNGRRSSTCFLGDRHGKKLFGLPDVALHFEIIVKKRKLFLLTLD